MCVRLVKSQRITMPVTRTAFITDFDYSFLCTLFLWSNLFSCHLFSDQCTIFTPENFWNTFKDTILSWSSSLLLLSLWWQRGFSSRCARMSTTIHIHAISRPHLHFVIVFLFHQFVMDSKIHTKNCFKKILTCMRNIEQSICNIHFTLALHQFVIMSKINYCIFKICAVWYFVYAAKSVCANIMHACVFERQKSR